MEREGIDTAFTFDRGFAVLGVQRIPQGLRIRAHPRLDALERDAR